MKVYVVSLGAGVLVGLIYSLLNVRSPAPPMVALVGLFGILVGEQLLPVGTARRLEHRGCVARRRMLRSHVRDVAGTAW
jgi:XapX domain-containing protein